MMDGDPVRSRSFVSASRRGDYDQLDADRFGLRRLVPAGSAVAVRSDDAVVVMAALWCLDGWAAEVHLVPNGVDPHEVAPGAPVITDEEIVDREPVSEPLDEGAFDTVWVIYTSGTTGRPKAIGHTLDSLTRTVVASTTAAEHCWGLLYDPNRMAGLQVILQAMRTRAALVAPDVHLPLASRIAMLVDAGVTALSATPTQWRQILQIPAARDWDLRQITLGGEIADQKVLSALASAFPSARIVHVFASTETGAAFSVRDGREGFPVDYLTDPPRGIALDIRDGILHVHAPGVSAAGHDGFAATGDQVEIVGDRVLFRGRDSGVVNIGGSNVWPEEVESVLRSHPEVAEAVVSVKENPLSGHVLIASVVPTPEAEPDRLGKRVRAWVREQAPATHVPAIVRVVEAIEVAATGKVRR